MSARHGNISPRSFPEQPGQWQIRAFKRDEKARAELGGPTGLRIVFGCPLKPGTACGVPLLPDRLPNGAGWQWDGDPTAPTLTPSINCVGGCGWHGHIAGGKFTP